MAKIVFGGTGMLGSAIVDCLRATTDDYVMAVGRSLVDLADQREVEDFFDNGVHPSDEVYNCAGLVGGISANMGNHFDALSVNALIALNVARACRSHAVARLNYVSSSCAYPRMAEQPMNTDSLGTGRFEPTNEGYAIAKYLGIKLSEYANAETGCAHVSFVPCNLYGPGDNFGESGHVLASIVRKVVDAKMYGEDSIVLWGDGTARREFLHTRDAAAAIVTIAQSRPIPFATINIGSGEDHSILELAEMVCAAADWHGRILFDPSKPNGMPQKLMDVSVLKSTGWRQTIGLRDGIARLIHEYRSKP